MSIEYKPLKELPKSKREATSEYDKTITKFSEDKESKYVEVSRTGVKSQSLSSALKSRIEDKKLGNRIKVHLIGGKVYLSKT